MVPCSDSMAVLQRSCRIIYAREIMCYIAGLDFDSFGSDLEAAKAAVQQHIQQESAGSGLQQSTIDSASSIGLLLNGGLPLAHLLLAKSIAKAAAEKAK